MKLETAYGIHAVNGLLDRHAGAVKSVLFSASRKDPRIDAIKKLASDRGIASSILEAKEFQLRFEHWRHQGVVAYFCPTPPLTEPEMLEMLGRKKEPPTVLVLDQITDPHNFGAILRTADATGVACVLVPKQASVGITPVVRKVASGAADIVPVCRVSNLARSLEELKSLGFWLYGATGEDDATVYGSVDYSGSVALVMGAEGKGLRRLSKEACDQLIRIPMAGVVSSLNVSVAAGVCLYEIARQREL